ncbi:uncharacterized protein LOC105628379 [Jatropha curcas]|uniref:uncharacterized protein LOC105628379 n=1 Tax=Jatropha curcas TaxID=180498 RepID=UPI001893F426|nr:uncharacterized protein LOC105628379 [Jatropha curcas]
MFRSLYTKSPSPILRHFCDLRTHLRFLTSTPLTRSFSSTISAVKEQLKNTSFTVSYLINSCGLSPQAAISASKKVQFLTPERPDSVLTLLNKHGFTNSQMAKIVKNDPRILLYDSGKLFLPKVFKFFSLLESLAQPWHIAQFISSNPPLLSTSLRNRIIPGYEFLMNALLFDDDMVIKAMSNQSRILRQDVEKISAPNLLFLRRIGTPQSLIRQILMHHPSVLCRKADKFLDKIKELIDMGFALQE